MSTLVGVYARRRARACRGRCPEALCKGRVQACMTVRKEVPAASLVHCMAAAAAEADVVNCHLWMRADLGWGGWCLPTAPLHWKGVIVEERRKKQLQSLRS